MNTIKYQIKRTTDEYAHKTSKRLTQSKNGEEEIMTQNKKEY